MAKLGEAVVSLVFETRGFTEQVTKATKGLEGFTNALKSFKDVAGRLGELPADMQRAVAALTQQQEGVKGLSKEQQILSQAIEDEKKAREDMEKITPTDDQAAARPEGIDQMQQSLSDSQDNLACINEKLATMRGHWAEIGTEADLFRGNLHAAKELMDQMGIQARDLRTTAEEIAEAALERAEAAEQTQEQAEELSQMENLAKLNKEYTKQLRSQQAMGRLTSSEVSFQIGQQGLLERIAMRIFGVKRDTESLTDTELRHHLDIERVTRRWRKDLIGASFILSVIGWKLASMNKSFVSMSSDLAFLSEDIGFYWEDIAELFGESIAPILENIFLPTMEMILDITERLPIPIRALTAGLFLGSIAILSMAGPMLGLVSTIKMVRNAWRSYVLGIEEATRKQRQHQAAMKQTAIATQQASKSSKSMAGGIAKGVAGFGLMLVLMTIMEPLMEAFAPILEVIGMIFEDMLDPILPLIDAFADWLDQVELGEKIIKFTTPGIVALGVLLTTIAQVVGLVWWGFKGLWDLFKESPVVTKLFNALQQVYRIFSLLGEAIGGVRGFLEWAWEWVKKLAEALFGSGLHAAIEAVYLILEILAPVLRGIVGFFTQLWEWAGLAAGVITTLATAVWGLVTALGSVAMDVLDVVINPTPVSASFTERGRELFGDLDYFTGLQHGGLVTRTGLAIVHKGEEYSGVGRRLPRGDMIVNVTVQGNMDRGAVQELDFRLSEMQRNEFKRRSI
jgi:hypothetical protein